jgi:hypothetical protein
MSPFDLPPSSPPVSFDPPNGPGGAPAPRRGRLALVTLAAAGLVGSGLVVAGHMASADEPTLRTEAASDPAGDTPERSGDESSDMPDTDGTDESTDDSVDGSTDDPTEVVTGEVVIDDGDGEPIVIDLGDGRDAFDCIGGPILDGPVFDGPIHRGDRRGPVFDEEFAQRIDEFLRELPWDEIGDPGEFVPGDDGVRIFGSGGSSITVVGPDGVRVIDLGDGDASVTIEQTDGELTVKTEGDAEVSELPDLGEFVPDLGELDPGQLPDLGDLFPLDPDEIRACLDELD